MTEHFSSEDEKQDKDAPSYNIYSTLFWILASAIRKKKKN